MKPLTLLLAAAAVLVSCTKVIPPNPIYRGDEVEEYHTTLYNGLSLFRKTYDATGTAVNEIDFFFWNVALPSDVNVHHLLVAYRGRNIYLMEKANPSDTVVRVTLNAENRVDNVSYTAALNDATGNDFPGQERYFYKNNRVIAAQRLGHFAVPPDSIYYDHVGNVVSTFGVPYVYDYSRRATQQFYCDDLMETYDGFYLMQYLGLFPEITSPVNVRTRAHDPVFINNPDGYTALSNWTFDPEGRLTGYAILYDNQVTITWHRR